MSAPAAVVLVHGAWHRAACWDKVVAALAARGIDAVAVELPFEGIAADVAAARAAIVAAGNGVVVVAHSYGGAVVSAAASGLENVAHLVYLCAFMLDAGEDAGAIASEHLLPLFDHLRLVDGRSTVDPAAAVDLFYGDCTPADTATAVGQLRSFPWESTDTGVRPAWRDIPSTYVVCTEDGIVPPVLQRQMAHHAAHVVEWPTSHSPFLSQPERIVALLAPLTQR